MPPALEIALEIYTWIGLGAAILLGIAALIAWVADGSWMPVHGVVAHVGDRTLVRWWDDRGLVNEAPVPAGVEVVDEQVDVWARVGRANTVRAVPHSPAVRSLARLTVGFAALALVGLVLSLVLLFISG